MNDTSGNRDGNALQTQSAARMCVGGCEMIDDGRGSPLTVCMSVIDPDKTRLE